MERQTIAAGRLMDQAPVGQIVERQFDMDVGDGASVGGWQRYQKRQGE